MKRKAIIVVELSLASREPSCDQYRVGTGLLARTGIMAVDKNLKKSRDTMKNLYIQNSPMKWSANHCKKLPQRAWDRSGNTHTRLSVLYALRTIVNFDRNFLAIVRHLSTFVPAG